MDLMSLTLSDRILLGYLGISLIFMGSLLHALPEFKQRFKPSTAVITSFLWPWLLIAILWRLIFSSSDR